VVTEKIGVEDVITFVWTDQQLYSCVKDGQISLTMLIIKRKCQSLPYFDSPDNLSYALDNNKGVMFIIIIIIIIIMYVCPWVSCMKYNADQCATDNVRRSTHQNHYFNISC